MLKISDLRAISHVRWDVVPTGVKIAIENTHKGPLTHVTVRRSLTRWFSIRGNCSDGVQVSGRPIPYLGYPTPNST